MTEPKTPRDEVLELAQQGLEAYAEALKEMKEPFWEAFWEGWDELLDLDPEPEYEPRNREKARQAKRGWFWCKWCDAGLVAEHGRCPSCGRKDDREKIRYE